MLSSPGAEFQGQESELPRVELISNPSVAEYRRLYNGVGSALHWTDRNRIPDVELQAILDDPRVEIYGFFIESEPAGYGEIDHRMPGEIEIAYFGLFPKFIGKGQGRRFLRWVLDRAWSHEPQRVWLHTCDLDHPAALPLYRSVGFVPFDERMIQQLIES